MNPIENVARVETLKAELNQHPMCARFVEDSGYYTVYYPEGMYPNGARAAHSMGKARALERLLVIMERHWNDNGIHGS
jgi:hypothetical protein